MHSKSGINSIIIDTKKFWDPKNVDTNLDRRSKRIFTYTKRVQRILLFVILTSIEFHFLKPFFNANDIFPINVWTIEDKLLLNLLVLMIEYYTLCIATVIVWSYDVIYFSTCIHLIVQLRLLKCKIFLKTKGGKDDLKICIEHHQLLHR